jgi:hypothetical protein
VTARPVAEALRRGTLAFAANPLLLAAQVGLWLCVLVLGGLSAAALVAGLLPFLLQAGLLPALDRLPWGGLFQRAAGAPAVAALAVGLLAALVGLTLLLLAVAFVQAGMFSVLVAADRQAAEGAPRSAFGVPRGTFGAGARRHGRRFFGLLNAYGVLASFLVTLALVAALALAAGIAKGHAALGALVLLATLPVVVVLGLLGQVVLSASSRELVLGDAPLLDAISSGFARVRATAGPSALLYLLLAAAGLVVGGSVSAPRLVLQFGMFGGGGTPSLGMLLLLALLSLVEWVVVCSLEVVKAGAFVALWGGGDDAAGADRPDRPPVPPFAFINTWAAPPAPAPSGPPPGELA